MIINIKGTSGSGKSTIVREIVKCYTGTKVAKFIDGRRQPIGYIHNREGDGPALEVIGHYETPCGGCDTINKLDEVFERVRAAHAEGRDVLFEGLLISADFNRTHALHEDGLPLLVVGLDSVPLDVCIESVNERRRAKRGPDAPPVNPKNTESKWKGTKKTMEKLREHGVAAPSVHREQAIGLIKGALNVR